MKSLVLVGFGSNEQNKRSYFILKKEQLFISYFNEILEKLNLSPKIIKEEGTVEDFENKITHYKNNELDLDVVYTENKIILILRSEPINLERFKSLIFTYASMEE